MQKNEPYSSHSSIPKIPPFVSLARVGEPKLRFTSMSFVHSFPPIVDSRARVLILGSMPGVASLEAREYYAHPRNAFWPIMEELFAAGPDLPYEQRCQRLRIAEVALWDVLRHCRREGSLDTAIDSASEVANNIAGLLADCPRIEKICFNGQKAETAFRRHVAGGIDEARLGRLRRERLPSTSPAHAGRSFAEKLTAWRAALTKA